MDRKNFFSKGVRDLAREFYQSPVGAIIDRQLSGLANLLDPRGLNTILPAAEVPPDGTLDTPFQRPPGALADPADFQSSCTNCGDCITACPYGSIFRTESSYGPVLQTAQIACHLCVDYPCVQACKDGALLAFPEDEWPVLGQAHVIAANCVNTAANHHQRRHSSAGKPVTCRECQQVCPVPGAVHHPRGQLPQITADCIGCGQCVAVCPAFVPAIEIQDA
ncbi:MAG: 4Fe-4S binding protein [Leptospiraceae bacterium]|nr:4Fe-4S binding protein [Leptospiraceae bacterium]